MIRALVNGTASELAPGTTLAEVVAGHCASARGVAVAVEREVIPRSRWAEVVVPEGARIEIVTAVAGG